MKMTTFFLFVICLHVSANTSSQTITLTGKHMQFSRVFTAIEKQTGYFVFFCKDDLQENASFSLSVNRMPLTDFLDLLLKDQPLHYRIEEKTIVLFRKPVFLNLTGDNLPAEPEPPARISGIIRNESGEPIPNASVRIRNSTTGVATDDQGAFELMVDTENAVLEITSIGYDPVTVGIRRSGNGYTAQALDTASAGAITVTPGANLFISITLKLTSISLDETVVIGYGSQRRQRITSAVVSVRGEELTKRVATDPASLLQGQLPGLSVVQNSAEPGNENIQLRIRGVGTFSGAGNNPLIIVNGIPGSLSVINPADIESITVLKDAAAAAIYGSRGANGVVVVKTRKGKAGGFSLQYNYNIGLSKPTRLPDLITNSATYMELLNEAMANTGNAPVYEQDQIDLYRNATDRVKYPNHNWLDDMFGTAVVHNHYLNLSGGNSSTTYSLGLSFTDQPGTMRGFDYKKYTVDLGLSSKVHKRVTLGTNLQFRYGDRNYPYVNSTDLYISTLAQTPLYPARTADGLWITKAYDKELNNKNPILTTEIRTHNPDYYGQGNISLDVDLFKGLKWENRAGMIFNTNRYKTFRPMIPVYLYSTMTFNRYQDVGNFGMDASNHQETHSTIYSQLNYNRTFGDHSISALGGLQQEVFQSDDLRAYRTGYPTNDLTEIDAGSPNGLDNGGTSSEWVIRSYYGSLNYAFRSKYLLGASLRYDGTSRLPSSSRWGLYGSVSGAWRISEEQFMQDIDWLDDLKIRGSWGMLGNQNIGTYPYQSTLRQSNYAFAGSVVTGFNPNQLVDPDLTWETTRITNIGIDLTALKGKLNFTADWFSKYTYDILRSSQVPQWLGMNAPIVNNGAVSNKGIELSLRYQNSLSKELSYYAVANFQLYRNKLVSFGEQEITGPDGQTIMKNGYPINSFYLQTMEGIFQSWDEINSAPNQSSLGGAPTPGDIRYKDVNGDKVVDANDRSIIPGQYPKFEYSYTMGVNWKQLDISLQLYGSYGNKVYLYKWGVDPFAQGAPPTTEWLNRWTPEKPSTTLPKIYLGYYGYDKITGVQSTFHLYDASFLRIKNLQVGYTLPQHLIDNAFKSIRVYASVDNLALITPLKQGTDPERLDISNKPDAWYGFANYPQNRTYTFGVSLQF